ncbi:MAG: hypothetical protein M1836_002651 [Candelina mexicana]|nr:MAG: hypothetical protein M1836_002651 [Candelina mexicana]
MAALMSKLTSSSLKLFSSLKPTSPTAVWRLLAIIFALLNLKALPFVWHLRLFSAIVKHIILRPRPSFTHLTGPRALFQPLITHSTTPILECDYNIHKSNSTYFSDLDISRTHLVSCLCAPIFKKGLRDNSRSKGKIAIMLGSVACSFRKEIKPHEGYEIWSRVLAWDQKWMYIVSHFVKKGVVKSKGYTLQQGKAGKGWATWFRRRSKIGLKHEQNELFKGPTISSETFAEDPLYPAIFATAISKYVFKINRRTIPPETILSSSDLLPPKPIPTDKTDPEQLSSPSPSPPSEKGSPPSDPLSSGLATASNLTSPSSPSKSDDVPQTQSNTSNSDTWDWDRVEKERLKGLDIAQSLAGLEVAHKIFGGNQGMALGLFGDMIW